MLSLLLCRHIIRYFSCQRQPCNARDGFLFRGEYSLRCFWIPADTDREAWKNVKQLIIKLFIIIV